MTKLETLTFFLQNPLDTHQMYLKKWYGYYQKLKTDVKFLAQ